MKNKKLRNEVCDFWQLHEKIDRIWEAERAITEALNIPIGWNSKEIILPETAEKLRAIRDELNDLRNKEWDRGFELLNKIESSYQKVEKA